MDAGRDVLRPSVVHYSDLVRLSSLLETGCCCCCQKEHERLESISGCILEALGPSGPGLISIAGVPDAPSLRKALLPLARKLALLPKHRRAAILKDHGLGSDVPLNNPDRTVSSFALQLKLPEDYQSTLNRSKHETQNHAHIKDKELESNRCCSCHDDEFEMLGDTFRKLGFCMMDLGLRLARICDKVIGGQELEHGILESCSAKGRLIHYHSTLDNHFLKESSKRMKGSKREESLLYPSLSSGSSEFRDQANPASRSHATGEFLEQLNIKPKATRAKHSRTSESKLWQQWHYDYGIFTIITIPLFLSSSKEVKTDAKDYSVSECSSPDGHTYLQLFDASKNKVLFIKSEFVDFIIQTGESADILSRGVLRSTLHSVGRPDGSENVSRETFVVFMQPAWNKVLHTSEHFDTSNIVGKESTTTNPVEESGAYQKKNDSSIKGLASDDSHTLKQDILKNVPPLTSRLKDGMTFAEFSRETTRQYYGGSGMQPRR